MVENEAQRRDEGMGEGEGRPRGERSGVESGGGICFRLGRGRWQRW